MAKFGTVTGLPGGVTVTFSPPPEVIAGEILSIANALDNTTPPLLLSKQIAEADMRMKFTTQTDPDGAPWEEWTQEYAKKRGPGKILTLTGGMAASAENGYYIRPNTLWWSMDSPFYWLFHETGTGEVWQPPAGMVITRQVRLGGRGKGLPQRRFASITKEAQFKMLAAFQKWFDGAITIGSVGKSGVRARIPAGQPGAGQFTRV